MMVMATATARFKEEPLIERLPVVRGLYEENAALGKRSWFRTGGNAEVLFQPLDAEDLQAFLEEKPEDVDLNIFGFGHDGVNLLRCSIALGLKINIPCPASPPRTFCQLKLVASNLFQSNS